MNRMNGGTLSYKSLARGEAAKPVVKMNNCVDPRMNMEELFWLELETGKQTWT